MPVPSEASDGENDTKASVCSSPDPGASNLAFLVHSQDSVRSNLPPDVDNKILARQKRRRTSPEDQQILEAEYKRNPKPDKAARLDIVGRVALGEKEVQVWFQNRRQHTRRRSRPSVALELGSQPDGGHDTMTSTFESTCTPKGLQVLADDAADPMNQERKSANPTELGAEHSVRGNYNTEQPVRVDVAHESQATALSETTDLASSPSTQDTAPTQFDSTQQSSTSVDHTRPSSAGLGYLANRRSASFIKSHDSHVPSALPSSSAPLLSTPALNRASSSYLRLSMTDDGHAQVIDRAAKSPSPHKIVDTFPSAAGLRRSYSAAGLHDRLKEAGGEDFARKFPRTSVSGRSRDSRVWEFWCDKDARNSLAAKADSELSGSAADAIEQIVASSKILRTNASRRNIQSNVHPLTSGGRPARPSLRRSSTTHGRIQTKTQQPQVKSIEGKKKDSNCEEWEHLMTESDKENWEPEVHVRPEDHKQSQPRPLQSQRTRKVLGENTQVLSQGSSLGSMMARNKTPRKPAGSPIEILDDEVATFMGDNGDADRNRASTSSGEELDCIHSLLSLSQGNWR